MQYKNINLIGRIDESLVKKFLLEYEMKQKNNISFFIHSTGGYIDSALEIANYMLSLDKEFISVAGARVASAAIILHQVAPLVRMAYKNSEFLLHRQYKKNRGKISLDEQEKEKSIFNLIALQTGLPLQQIYELADAETKFSAKEAFDLGFVTKVIDSPSPVGGNFIFLKKQV